MKTSCLGLKLFEFNFFASFTTDDQSIFNVSRTMKIQNSTLGSESMLVSSLNNQGGKSMICSALNCIVLSKSYTL